MEMPTCEIAVEKLREKRYENELIINKICQEVAKEDYLAIPAKTVLTLLSAENKNFSKDWAEFQESWNRLEQDNFMKDGGKYRFRRHGVYSAVPAAGVQLELPQPHYQSVQYNSLNGGIPRYFAPIESSIASGKILMTALEICHAIFSGLAPFFCWHIEVHQFRIVATSTATLPTPEGIHRDGVNFVFMMLVNRVNVLNGETGIYNRERQELTHFTLLNPLDVAIVNDERTMHGVTPILAKDPTQHGYRDVLVITFNKR
ncbi:2OG-Fe dioxygenase family protein [Serratia microhaemolytica]|uniref:2OG-Fe dioxygenase family protein n=1 Tax=Serratia microhaemolytica TaxID=2675110 RepID=UPI000FDCE6A8|nr:2OG-Fe dioxygenase family protein [Serratia microhaemolytica]